MQMLCFAYFAQVRCEILFGDSWSYVFFGALASAGALFVFGGVYMKKM
jgi:hypothetical protein